MNSTLNQASPAPQPLLPMVVRLCAGLAVLGLVSAAWLTAEHASHEAVAEKMAELSRTYVMLQPVYIVARRDAADAASIAASSAEYQAAPRSTGM